MYEIIKNQGAWVWCKSVTCDGFEVRVTVDSEKDAGHLAKRIAQLPELEANYENAVEALQACYDELQSMSSVGQSLGEHARNLAKTVLTKEERDDKLTEGKVLHQDESKLNIPKPSGPPPAPNASMHNATVAMCKANKEITRLLEIEANYKEAVEALSDLYNAIDSCMELTPDVMRNAKAALTKAEKSR